MSTEKIDTGIRQGQLAQAALSLVTSSGLKGLSVARVARRVGLAPSAVYRHFTSKDKLLASVLNLIQQRLEANVVSVSTGYEDPLEALRELLMSHARMIRVNGGILHVVLSEQIHRDHSQRRTRIHGLVKHYLGQVAELVAQGQTSGHIRPDLHPATVALMLLGLVQPAAILWHLSDGDFAVTKHVERAWQIFSERLRAG